MSAVDMLIEQFCEAIADVRDEDYASVTLAYWAAQFTETAAALHALGADNRLPELDRLLRTALRYRFGGGSA